MNDEQKRLVCPEQAPDQNEAAGFLKNLDPCATFFTFQTFDDNKERKDCHLARVLHGTLEQHWDGLVRLNEALESLSPSTRPTVGAAAPRTLFGSVRYSPTLTAPRWSR
jgi:hypothetical protein